jgi:hypothetical protein
MGRRARKVRAALPAKRLSAWIGVRRDGFHGVQEEFASTSICSSALAMLSLTVLGGCAVVALASVPFSTLPLVNVAAMNDGSVYELSGELVVNMNKTSTFSVTSADGDIVCKGSTDIKGRGASVCNGGLTIVFNIPEDKFGKFNGSYVDTQPDYRVAAGWGTAADLAALRAMLGL